jgi:hypothetical protein
MRDRNLDLLLAVFIAAAMAAAAAVRAPTSVLLPLGVALMVVAGYVAGEAMLGTSVRGLEGTALTAVLALGVPAVGGVLLHVEGVPLHRGPWIVLLALVTMVGAVVASSRRALAAETAPPDTDEPAGALRDTGLPKRSPGRAAVMAIAVLVAATAVGVAVAGANAQHQPGFTELSLVPQTGSAVLRVRNFEGRRERYLVVLRGSGAGTVRFRLDLESRGAWAHKVIPPGGAGLRADLFVGEDSVQPYRTVYLARTQ